MKALVLAGGKATRLYPMTLIMPKQLIMINGYPVIKYIIDHCRNNGINGIVVCMSDNSFKYQFYNALPQDMYPGMTIEYSVSPESFKTSGRILAAREFMTEDDFVVYYGDIITEFNLRSLIDFHRKQTRKNGCICTLATIGSKELEYGVALQKDKVSRITYFKEGPRISDISDFRVNVGISVCNKGVLQYCQEKSDFYGDVIPHMIEQGEYVYGYEIDKPFIDIGTLKAIEKATKTMRRRRQELAKKCIVKG